ncbi:Protein of unknown function [Malonomonas rubra DSM 5091]|uniref:DUF3124 domain-containing protein n=1 Tax=Malonomonas rubra DSM 5091 TaxID=1122189 RepID=A0A1M6M736_MALRU|nr:DUF3124 domain-containing protein [Malonomonas rubra]SHJ79291.1 Protein of unknown function [Malonomonas rubra DSM 5091]
MKKLAALISLVLMFAAPAFSAEEISLSSGQTVYVAIYSHVFTGPKEHPFNLAAMLSIRNTDLHNPITILSAEYFDNSGHSLKEYAPKPIALAPLASHHFSIKESDEAGGFGANFIVRWAASKAINAPIIESVMIGARSGQGISFVSQGKVIAENTN